MFGLVSRTSAKFGQVGEQANEGSRLAPLGDLLGTTIHKRRLHQDARFGVPGAGSLHGAREIAGKVRQELPEKPQLFPAYLRATG
jgi:hypothetical protein